MQLGETISTKDLILKKAAQLFATKGYEATSISMIAKEVKIGKSAVYAHFSSKQEIIDHIIEKYGPANIVDYFSKVSIDSLIIDPYQEFTHFMNGVLDFFLEERSRLFIDFLRMGCTNFSNRSPLTFQQAAEGGWKAAEKLLKKLQTKGIVRDDCTAEFLAWELMSSIIHARLMYFNSSSDEKDIKRGIRMCINHIKHFIENNFKKSSI